MKVSLIVTLLVVALALSTTDAGLIRLALRGIKIGVKAIVGAVTGGGTATVVTTAVLTAADLALNLGNVLSKGCMYEKEICSLTPEIENLEKQMVPLYNQLTLLDQKNTKTYNDLTKNLEKQNELAKEANKMQALVVSIIQKLGDPAKLDRLGQEFERNTKNMVNTFKTELQQYQKSMEGKAVMSGIADSSLLLYFGAKQAYTSLKTAGKISSPKMLKTIKFPKTGLTSLAKPKVITKISSSLTTVKNFFKKPSVAKFASKAASGGMVLGSVVGLGVTLAVDISQAKKMKNSLRNTRDEMKRTLNELRNEINREKTTERDLATAFQDIRKKHIELVQIINPSLKNKLSTSAGSNSAQLYNYQVQALAVFRRLNAELTKMEINFSVIEEVTAGVEMGDDLNRIRTTIQRKGLGSFNEGEILNIIAEQFPSKTSYKGKDLKRYRG